MMHPIAMTNQLMLTQGPGQGYVDKMFMKID